MAAHRLRAACMLAVAVAVAAAAAVEFVEMWQPDDIRPAESLTSTRRLSHYLPSLLGTAADASVYEFAGPEPGPTVLVLGGTHPNEPAGFIAAVLLTENVRMRKGRMLVVPQACLSGFTATDPLEGSPQRFEIPTPHGTRSFRFGGRSGNVVHQWPDPLVYLQYPSGQQLSGIETRNLNRAYPGRPDGTLTEQTAWAIVTLIRREGVHVAVDLHEAAPETPIINALITHEKGRDLAAAAILNLEFEELRYALEISPLNFRGLSHREWGDSTGALPFLMETCNPIQGRLRGETSAGLLLLGEDRWYRIAAALGRIRVTYQEQGEPLAQRAGRHTQGLIALLDAYNEEHIDAPFAAEGIPGYADLARHGVGAFLR